MNGIKSADGASATAEQAPVSGTISLDQVVARPVNWLWTGKIPLGAITVLAGNPGEGKSLLSLKLAAALSRGTLPGSERPGHTLLLSAEDSVEATIRPRLDAAKADTTMIHMPRTAKDGAGPQIVLPDNVDRLQVLVEEHHAKLVVIDPLSAFLAPNINSWKEQQVRAALAPLAAMAEKTGAAILVVAHLNKGDSDDPLRRLGGSMGIPAAARSVLLLAHDPDDPEGDQGSRRVLAHIKSNNSELSASQLVEISEETVNGTESPAITFGGFSAHDGRALLAARTAQTPDGKRAKARALLIERLTRGPVLERLLVQYAAAQDISERTLKRAKKDLEITSRKTDFDGSWMWQMPKTIASMEATQTA